MTHGKHAALRGQVAARMMTEGEVTAGLRRLRDAVRFATGIERFRRVRRWEPLDLKSTTSHGTQRLTKRRPDCASPHNGNIGS